MIPVLLESTQQEYIFSEYIPESITCSLYPITTIFQYINTSPRIVDYFLDTTGRGKDKRNKYECLYLTIYLFRQPPCLLLKESDQEVLL